MYIQIEWCAPNRLYDFNEPILCWATKITYQDEDYIVYVRENRKSDCFVVTKCRT